MSSTSFMSRLAVWVSAAVVIAQPLAAQNRSATLESVARTLGGMSRILAVRSIVLEGTGDNYNFGQNLTPEAPLPRFEVTSFKRTMDYANKRWFTDQTRVPRFITGNTAAQRQRFGIDGDVAYNVVNDTTTQRVTGQTAAERATALMSDPIGFLQVAFAPGTEVIDDLVAGGVRRVRINAGGKQMEMYVDDGTKLPLRTQIVTYNPMLGDVTSEIGFDDWRDVDGVKLPMHVTQKLAGRFVLADYRATSARINTEVSDIASNTQRLPAQPAVALQNAPPPVNVTVEQIVPGVWYLAGQTHHSVAIEQSKEIVLVEAPQNDARTLAVIEKARALVPGKPVNVVINTHHHFDHSGGVRAAVSQGLTILTHAGNRDFYERTVLTGRHSSAPDALARNRQPLRLMTVTDKYVRSDSLRNIEVYAINGSPHSGTMLVVYLPAERLLVQADLYNAPAPNAPPPPAFPFAANLLENIQRRGLQVDRVVGIHGRVVPLSEIQAVASRTQ